MSCRQSCCYHRHHRSPFPSRYYHHRHHRSPSPSRYHHHRHHRSPSPSPHHQHRSHAAGQYTVGKRYPSRNGYRRKKAAQKVTNQKKKTVKLAKTEDRSR